MSQATLIDTSFKVKNDWSRGGGFTGEIALTNKGNNLQDWTLEFEADFEITKIWNGEIVSHVGDRYVIKGGRWNQEIDKGETVSFGFNAKVDNHTITK
ncbi:MAG: cellulose binding domain-containing protein, partial [Xenococcaceae cyanobacterium]